MKKRALARVLAGVMAASLLAGCGNADTASSERHHRDFEETETESASSTDKNNDSKGEDYDGIETEEYFASDDYEIDGFSNANGMDSSYLCVEESCADSLYGGYDYVDYYEPYAYNTEEYSAIEENSFCSVATSPLSTFSADVDTASYANLRRLISYGYYPDEIPSGAVRTEEMLNYFSYDYEGPKGDEPFGVNAMISDCPWNEDSKLLMLGLQTEDIDFSEAEDSNIVFLIDVSGSMYDDDKLPLLKQSFEMLLDNLGEKDRVSIVTYADGDEVVIEGVPGSDKETIVNALEGLEAGGSTNGGEGILSAYDIAEKYFIEGGNNRVILATDGDLNVGVTSESELKDLITEKKESGVYLSVLGFGTGNYSDTNMEALADYGNGNYSYIDSLSEAKKVLVEELGATLVTVAKDVKLQVEFNPAVVSEYRLIGYENRTMADEDFADDSKDAGEIGAGHSVTVLYELVLADEDEEQGSSLRYQNSSLTSQATDSNEWLTLSVRYKEPDGDKSNLLEYPIGTDYYTEKPNSDFLFAASVAEFSMLLRNSQYIADGSYDQVLENLEKVRGMDEYQAEFVDMVKTMNDRSKEMEYYEEDETSWEGIEEIH